MPIYQNAAGQYYQNATPLNPNDQLKPFVNPALVDFLTATPVPDQSIITDLDNIANAANTVVSDGLTPGTAAANAVATTELLGTANVQAVIDDIALLDGQPDQQENPQT